MDPGRGWAPLLGNPQHSAKPVDSQQTRHWQMFVVSCQFSRERREQPFESVDAAAPLVGGGGLIAGSSAKHDIDAMENLRELFGRESPDALR